MEIALAILGILITIGTLGYNRYSKRGTKAEILIDIEGRGHSSYPIGIVATGVQNEDGSFNASESTRAFNITYTRQIVLRNNTEFNAHFPKLLVPDEFRFGKIDKLNELESIQKNSKTILNFEVYGYDEVPPNGKRLKMDFIPDTLKNLELVLEYQNDSKINFYSKFSMNTGKTIILSKKPEGFNYIR